MIGWIMLAIPFIAFFLYVAKNDGIKVAATIFFGTAAVALWFFAAVYFIGG